MLYGFFIMSALALLSALGVVCFKNSIHSALSLILNLLCIAGLFASLDAHFLAAVQVIVYAGAIMVLVVFLIMLLNLKVEQARPMRRMYWVLTALVGGGFLTIVVPSINQAFSAFPDPVNELDGSVAHIGHVLYRQYLFPFEAASILILAAIVGAVMLSKRVYRRGANGAS